MSTPQQDSSRYYAPALRRGGSDRPPQPPEHNYSGTAARQPPRHEQHLPPRTTASSAHHSSQSPQYPPHPQQLPRPQRKPVPPIPGRPSQQSIAPMGRHRPAWDQPAVAPASQRQPSKHQQHQQPRSAATPQRGGSGYQPLRGQHDPPRPPHHGPSVARGGGVGRQSSLTRNRSLSRPDRYRPRTGMVRTTPPAAAAGGYPHHAAPVPPAHAPTPSAYGVPLHRPGVPDHRLHQQKLRQQQEAGLGHAILRNPVTTRRPSQPHKTKQQQDDDEQPRVLTSWWAWTAWIATCCIPACCLRTCCHKRSVLVQQAWREKIALVLGIILLCCALVYITYGLNMTLCPEKAGNVAYSAVGADGVRRPVYTQDVRVFGRVYDLDRMKDFFATQGLNLTNDYENMDLGPIFDGDTKGACSRLGQDAALGSCTLSSVYGSTMTTRDGKCIPLGALETFMKPTGSLGFDWYDLTASYTYSSLAVLGNTVLNLTMYMNNNNSTAVFGDYVDNVLQTSRGIDVSYQLLYEPAGSQARDCLVARYSSGMMESDTGGCIAAQIIMNLMLTVIVAMIVIRYSMALTFQWFIAGRLVKPGGRSNWLAWRSIKGGNDDPDNHIPGPYAYYSPSNHAGTSSSSSSSSLSSRRSDNLEPATAPAIQTDMIKAELYTILLVTCYSEGYDGLRTTMDSLAQTTYSKRHKCFMVVCDGMITGAGETQSTPDIVVGMMDLDPTMRQPKSASYVAIADGERQLNMAKVYAGHYNGVPCIAVVKCGTEEELNKPKAGNRGKRDSQLIVMQFFQRVLFNDRLSALDYEIFWKMTWLMKGVTPDKFELVLMVDADTKVLPDALTYMVAAMANDITIMGLCGETRIANKLSSWVTAIQVFEYYISHNYAKAFESLFGIVTCLPGCFSMYRIKAPKHRAWVPILANPDIILEYNQNIVTTLHAKNLLLLGEDRFLSTLMLRTFPRRQMMYVPQARCKTVVPDQFRVLLSQRRRWVNSTVHNLMELVLVSDLCGIACLSMQFSVFVDLVGTLVLPAAICLTVYLIVNTAVSSDPQWQSLALLVAILGLPAVLIAVTTFKIVYIGWMCVYLIALPIWNFVLPIYSYWHFDDFSWGATRVVVGEKKDKGHLDGEGKFDSSRLVMKKWEDWEAERTGQPIMPRNRPILLTPQMTPPPPAAPTRLANPIFVNRQLYSPPLKT